jgi:hypothetical protein
MGRTVLADAQFGVVRILRPYAGFEAVYGGLATTVAVAFTQGGQPLDPLAGQPGYSPTLLRGLPVPVGARILIWFPIIFTTTAPRIPYAYSVAFRYRSVFDYRQNRGPWHYAKQAAGVPDTTAPPGKQVRVVKPATWATKEFVQAEPAINEPALINLHNVEFVVGGGSGINPPVLPGPLTGTIQQGVLDPATFGSEAIMPLFQEVEVIADGDEMLILGTRDTVDGAWNFATTDKQFSVLYGNGSGKVFPDVGILTSVGTRT